jgi:hypothetical protein
MRSLKIKVRRRIKRRLTINALSTKLGIHRNAIHRKLFAAGLLPPEKFEPAKVLEALKPEENAQTVRDKKIFEEWRKLKILNDFKEAKLVSVERVITRDAAMIASVRTLLQQKLQNEYPVMAAGQDAPHIREIGRKLEDQLLVEFSRLAEHWTM